MKAVIDRLVNHLGLAADASEAVILEKMTGLPAADAVAELRNSLTQAQGERDQLQTALTAVRQELVNRDLTEFEGVISAESREFWSDQLMANREQAVGALRAFAKGKAAGGEKGTEGGNLKPDGGTRRPLHNWATARPVIPGQGGGEPEADSRAVRIRNRAHEICKAEKVSFGQAFRRAESEVSEQ